MVIADRIENRSLIGMKASKSCGYEGLEIGCRDPSSRSFVLGSPDDQRPRYVVPIARPLLDGMTRRKSFAGLVKNQSGEETWLFRIRSGGPIDPIPGKDCLNLVP